VAWFSDWFGADDVRLRASWAWLGGLHVTCRDLSALNYLSVSMWAATGQPGSTWKAHDLWFGHVVRPLNRSVCVCMCCLLKVKEIQDVYKQQRDEIVTVFATIYHQAVVMAEKVGTEPVQPRCTGRQQHRSNVSSSSVEQYYRLNLAVPFLDFIVIELDSQFSGRLHL
jgi:hypothetical protein